mgnify:CR=1 FL=1
MKPHRTEEVYDAEIAPLVTQIIEICQRENLPLLVNVGLMLPDDQNGTDGYIPSQCTTFVRGSSPPMGPPTSGLTHRHELCLLILDGDGRWDTAGSLRVTSNVEGLEPCTIGVP